MKHTEQAVAGGCSWGGVRHMEAAASRAQGRQGRGTEGCTEQSTPMRAPCWPSSGWPRVATQPAGCTHGLGETACALQWHSGRPHLLSLLALSVPARLVRVRMCRCPPAWSTTCSIARGIAYWSVLRGRASALGLQRALGSACFAAALARPALPCSAQPGQLHGCNPAEAAQPRPASATRPKRTSMEAMLRGGASRCRSGCQTGAL